MRSPRRPAALAGERIEVVVASSPVFFPRERLFARLDACLEARVTLLHGSAGTGKSTTLRAYLAARGIDHLTFNATPNHAAPVAFVRGLADAVASVAPAMTVAAARVTEHFSAADALAWAADHVRRVQPLLVLDGLHHVLGDPATADFVRDLVDATADGTRWILATRDAAALPVARWFSSGRLRLPIDDADLRIDLDDLRQVTDAGDDQALLELLARTGGAALELAVALDGGPSTAGPRADLYAHVVDAALETRDAAGRARMYATGIAGTIDGPLLTELGFDPAATLRDLLDARLIYVRDDARYAFHDGYRERLAISLAQRPPDERSIVTTTVAGALERVGRWREAIDVLLPAAEPEPLAALIDRIGFIALDADAPLVRRALDAVPESVLAGYPAALAVRAMLASADEIFDVSEAWFGMAIAAADAAPRREIVLRYGLDLVRRERPDAVDVLEAERARDDGTGDDDPVLCALLATAYSNVRRADEARTFMQRALRRLGDVRDDALRSRVLHQAAYVALADKDYRAAKDLAERSYDVAANAHLHEAATRVASVLYVIAIDVEDDVPAARRHLARMIESARLAGSASLRIYATLALYEIEAIAGATDAMVRLDGELRDLRLSLTPLTSQTLLPAQALRASWDGRFEHAYTLLAAGAESVPEDDRRAQRCAEAAMYAAAAGLRGEAARAMRAARAALRLVDPNDRWALHTAAFLAIAEILLAHDGRARSAVAELRAIARRSSARFAAFVAAVVALHMRWIGTGTAYDVGDALDRLDGLDLGGIARLLAALPLPSTTRGKAILLGDTEKAVLEHVARGLTSKEIAAELGRSSQTIDVHIRTICKKLGCSGRRQAVALALNEGIIRDRRSGDVRAG